MIYKLGKNKIDISVRDRILFNGSAYFTVKEDSLIIDKTLTNKIVKNLELNYLNSILYGDARMKVYEVAKCNSEVKE